MTAVVIVLSIESIPVGLLITLVFPGPPEKLASILSDPEALADIREADAAYQAGQVIRGVDAARRLRS